MELGLLCAVVLGLTEVAKKAGLPSKYSPIIALVLAIGFNFLILMIGETNQELLINALIAGLSAMGLYSGGKALGSK